MAILLENAGRPKRPKGALADERNHRQRKAKGPLQARSLDRLSLFSEIITKGEEGKIFSPFCRFFHSREGEGAWHGHRMTYWMSIVTSPPLLRFYRSLDLRGDSILRSPPLDRPGSGARVPAV